MRKLLAATLLLAAHAGLGADAAHSGTLASATWTSELFGFTPGAPLVVPVSATGSSTASSVSVGVTLPAFAGSSIGFAVQIYTHQQLTLAGAQGIAATAGMADVTDPRSARTRRAGCSIRARRASRAPCARS